MRGASRAPRAACLHARTQPTECLSTSLARRRILGPGPQACRAPAFNAQALIRTSRVRRVRHLPPARRAGAAHAASAGGRLFKLEDVALGSWLEWAAARGGWAVHYVSDRR